MRNFFPPQPLQPPPASGTSTPLDPPLQPPPASGTSTPLDPPPPQSQLQPTLPDLKPANENGNDTGANNRTRQGPNLDYRPPRCNSPQNELVSHFSAIQVDDELDPGEQYVTPNIADVLAICRGRWAGNIAVYRTARKRIKPKHDRKVLEDDLTVDDGMGMDLGEDDLTVDDGMGMDLGDEAPLQLRPQEMGTDRVRIRAKQKMRKRRRDEREKEGGSGKGRRR